MITTRQKDIGRKVRYRLYRLVDQRVVGDWIAGKLVDGDAMTVTVHFDDGTERNLNRVDLEFAE